MKGTNILLGIIALILALFFGLQIEEQYRDVRYLNNCKKDIKANGIKPEEWSNLMNDDTIETAFKHKHLGLPDVEHHMDDYSRPKNEEENGSEETEDEDGESTK